MLDVEEDAKTFFEIRNMNVDVQEPARQAYVRTLPESERANEDSCNVIKVYMDDILLATKTIEQHLKLLEQWFLTWVRSNPKGSTELF